jgi:hypothetical protein
MTKASSNANMMSHIVFVQNTRCDYGLKNIWKRMKYVTNVRYMHALYGANKTMIRK